MYYVIKNDTGKGYKLVSSYTSESQAETYGKNADDKVYDKVFRAKFDSENVLVGDEGEIVRGILKNLGSPKETGRFSLWIKDGSWEKHRKTFPTYGAANTVAKTLIDSYEEIIIIEETQTLVKPYINS